MHLREVDFIIADADALPSQPLCRAWGPQARRSGCGRCPLPRGGRQRFFWEAPLPRQRQRPHVCEAPASCYLQGGDEAVDVRSSYPIV